MTTYYRAVLCLLTLASVLLPVAVPALACPFCEGGPTGRNEVKEAIFSDSFWFNVGAAALPFVVVFGVVIAIHGIPTRQASALKHEGVVDDRQN